MQQIQVVMDGMIWGPGRAGGFVAEEKGGDA